MRLLTGRAFHGDRIVAALAVTETISWGVLYYAIGVLALPMERELGWSREVVFGGFSLGLLVQALASIPVGRWLDRHGGRALMSAGSLAAATLVWAWSQVTTVAAYLLIWIGLGLAMAAVLYEPAFATLSRWFDRHRPRALMTVTLAAGLASTIFLPLTEALVSHFGWRGALLAWAAVLAVVTLPLHAFVLRRDPADLGQHPDGEAGVGPLRPPPAEARAPVRGGDFAGLAAAFALSAVAAAAASAHLVPMLAGRGHSESTAALVAGWMGLMQLPGRLLFPWLRRTLRSDRVTPVLFAAQAAALALVALAEPPWLWVGVGLLGAAGGLLTLARATEVADRHGLARYGALSGRLAFATTLARAAGPIGAAALLGPVGGYSPLLVLLAALAACAAALSVAGPATPQAARDTPASYQPRVAMQARHTDSITGTSTSTPTTVASAAPEPGPYSAIAVATASSKKLEAPISAPGAATR